MNALTSNENLSGSRIDQSQPSRVTFCCSRDSVNAIKVASNVQQREFRCALRAATAVDYAIVFVVPPLTCHRSSPPHHISYQTK